MDAPIGARAGETSEEVGRYYDGLDEIYRGQAARNVHHGLWLRGDETRAEAKQNMVWWVGDRLGLNAGENCVDIGCGYGDIARYFATAKHVSVTAVTNSARQHAFGVQAKISKGVEYYLADWCKNALPGAAYDAAWAVESLEHMTDLDAALSQCRRVLRSGGRLLVLSWLARTRPRASNWERIAFLTPTARQFRLCPLRTEEMITQALFTAGFEQIRVSDLTRNVRRTWYPTAAGILQRLRPQAGATLEPGVSWTTLRTAGAYAVGALRYAAFFGVANGVAYGGGRGD
jgi:tocopherol O-methyltransferase